MTRFLILALALFGSVLAGCSQEKPISETNAPVSAQSAAAMDSAARSAPAADSAQTATGAVYECPMKCAGSRSPQPGSCPVCGMALVKNT
jgi:hypothetical protein